MSPDYFPIQESHRAGPNGLGRVKDVAPRLIPWDMIAPHEQQAQANHYQTLQRLAERGGVCACEACAILEDRRWRMFDNHADAELRLGELLHQWELRSHV